MDVSNTTDRDAQYRVSGAGAKSVVGSLPAQDYAVVVPPPAASSWRIEFFAKDDGRLLAREVVDDPKTSVVLIDRDGAYRVVSSVAAIDAFISYPHTHREWAERLDVALRARGVSTWLDDVDLKPGSSWREEVERAIGEARTILVLVGAEAAGEQQRAEWRVALEAVWRDPTKRLVPILIGDAQLPNFVRSTRSPRGVVAAIQLDPQSDWSRDLDALVAVVKSEKDLRKEGKVLVTAADDRRRQQEWLSYLQEVAAEFR
jgi:hypothetical protein